MNTVADPVPQLDQVDALIKSIRIPPRPSLLADMRRRYESGCPLAVETYLERFPAVAADTELKLDLVYADYLAACEFGTVPSPSALVARFPELADALDRLLHLDALLDPTMRPGLDPTVGPSFLDTATAWEPGADLTTDPGGCGGVLRRPTTDDVAPVAPHTVFKAYWAGPEFMHLLASTITTIRTSGGLPDVHYDDCALYDPASCKLGLELQSTSICTRQPFYYGGREPVPGVLTWPEFLDAGARVAPSDLAAREAALQFDDRDSASQILSRLRGPESTRTAALLDSSGRTFGSGSSRPSERRASPAPSRPAPRPSMPRSSPGRTFGSRRR